MNPAYAIAMVFVGCASNVVFLEFLVKDFPGSGNIITFSQFLFIALEGFIFTTKFGRKAPVIPLRVYAVMVALFFVVQVVNNWALKFNISVPVHIIFRSGSLIANLVLGVIILKRRYPITKYMAVLMITVGIAICTLVSTHEMKGDTKEEQEAEFSKWLIGVAMLAFALFMSARMGIYQEQVYAEFGKHPSEALFYNHALPLPGFLLLATDLYSHALAFNQSPPIMIPYAGFYMPKMWLCLLGNVLTQYICIRSVFILTTECTSLTVTLVVTLRKFFSLLISIWYFQNPFTLYHWIGTSMVFGGIFIFTEVFSKIRDALKPAQRKKID